MLKFSASIFLSLTAVLTACSSQEQSVLDTSFPEPTGAVFKHAAVVSARQEASDIGMQVMRNGGNAFDAMVAVEMALAVAYPFAGSPGGGGFAVYRLANGEVGALDFREKAPLAAHRDMYLDENGEVIRGMSTEGATAVGVPGTIAGVFAVHERFATKPFAELMEPVIALAEDGVVVTEYQAGRLGKSQQKIRRISGEHTKFAQDIEAGQMLKYPALANTIRRLVEGGRDAFYKGAIAKEIVELIQKNGGFITEEDLARYEVVWRDPIQFNYKDLTITAMSPPSSGGITLQQILTMIAPHNIGQYSHNSVQAIQLLAEASRRAYADRNHFLGDPDFVDIPYKEMTAPAYLEARMSGFSFDQATKSADVGHGKIDIIESEETTHYSIVDAQGNAVAVTMTINGGYGSKLYSDELGFFFNNQMDDFSAKPGVPNMFGLIGSDANSIRAEKRMLSSMTPSIVSKGDDLFMVLGAPGGSTIITSVAQTILNVYEFGMSMQDAVNAPRFHHQWMPDSVWFEHEGFDQQTFETLKQKGYDAKLGWGPVIGKVDAILVRPNGDLETGADRRGDDAAAGY